MHANMLNKIIHTHLLFSSSFLTKENLLEKRIKDKNERQDPRMKLKKKNINKKASYPQNYVNKLTHCLLKTKQKIRETTD
jgi:guanylate kinase